MIKVICIGHASYDMYVKVDEFPKENDKLRFVVVVVQLLMRHIY